MRILKMVISNTKVNFVAHKADMHGILPVL